MRGIREGDRRGREGGAREETQPRGMEENYVSGASSVKTAVGRRGKEE